MEKERKMSRREVERFLDGKSERYIRSLAKHFGIAIPRKAKRITK